MSSMVHIRKYALVFILAVLGTSCHVDSITATMGGRYPYVSNACNYDVYWFEAHPRDLFASAGESIWLTNRSACGNKYQLSCTAASSPGACINETIVVTIVDRALNVTPAPLKNGCAFVLPNATFRKIATQGTELVNVDMKLFQTN